MDGTIKLKTRYYAAGMREDGSYDRELFGYREETQDLDLDKSAFFLVDVYGLGYDDQFNEPERPSLLTKTGFYRERQMIRENIAPALNAAREAGMNIVYVTNVDPGVCTEKSEFAKLMKRSFSIDIEDIIGPGRDDTAYSDIVAPRKGEYLVKKQMYSGFFESPLESLLRNLEVKNLISVGFDTNICLRATLEGAFYRNFRVILLRDCTLGCEFPDTEDTLLFTKLGIKHIEWTIGYSATSEDFIKSLKAMGLQEE